MGVKSDYFSFTIPAFAIYISVIVLSSSMVPETLVQSQVAL